MTLDIHMCLLVSWHVCSLDLSRVLSKENLLSWVHAQFSTIPYGIWLTCRDTPIQTVNGFTIDEEQTFLMGGKITIKVTNGFIWRAKVFLHMLLLKVFLNAWLFLGSLTLTYNAIVPPKNPIVYQLHCEKKRHSSLYLEHDCEERRKGLTYKNQVNRYRKNDENRAFLHEIYGWNNTNKQTKTM